MKNLILSVLFVLLTVISIAQSGNGGQFNENTAAKLQWASYSNGVYSVMITNKQSNAVVFDLNIGGTVTSTPLILSGASLVVQRTQPFVSLTSIKIKPQTRFDDGVDMGWLEISAPASLPLKYGNIKTTKLNSTTVRLYITVYDASDDNVMNINLLKDGKFWKTLAVVFPENALLNKQYFVDLKLK